MWTGGQGWREEYQVEGLLQKSNDVFMLVPTKQWQGASRDVDECKRDVLGRTANAYPSTEFESKRYEGTKHNEDQER